MAVTKEELAVYLSEKSGETITRSKQFIDDFIDVMADVLAGGNEINLRDSFRLKVIERKPKKAYDFTNKTTIDVPAKKVLKFVAGKDFEERVLGCRK